MKILIINDVAVSVNSNIWMKPNINPNGSYLSIGFSSENDSSYQVYCKNPRAVRDRIVRFLISPLPDNSFLDIDNLSKEGGDE